MSDCALHLIRPHQRPIKYFTSTAFFEVEWEGYYATIITKLFAKKKTIRFCCVPHALHAAVYTRLWCVVSPEQKAGVENENSNQMQTMT